MQSHKSRESEARHSAVAGETARTVLVVGDLDLAGIDLAIRRAGAVSASCRNAPSALARLRGGSALPVCVLVSGEEDVLSLVEGIRDEATLFAVPVMALLARPAADDYRGAYLSGADDAVLLGDTGGLTRRIGNLDALHASIRPAATLGSAVVASQEMQARRRLGRTLRQVGFDVRFANALADLRAMVEGGDAPAFVVTTERGDMQATEAAPGGGRNVSAVFGGPVLYIPPDTFSSPTQAGDEVADVTSRLLFFADERAKARFKDRRSSARKLYAGVCTFREAGSPQPNYGVTHNVSRDGMYVRTFDPPRSGGETWVELLAPLSDTPIHLRAKVAWQRLPGATAGILQPGFGLQLDPQQCATRDLQALLKGYEALPE